MVVRVGECRLQRHHTQGATLRCPSAIVLGTCIHIVARREALTGESQRVEQGLDGGSHLTMTRTQHVVVGEVVEVQAWHVSLHLSVLWIDGNGACAQELLIVDDGVARAHPDFHLLRRVVGASIFEHTHINRCVECLHDFLVAQSVLFHHTIAFTPTDVPVDDLVHLLNGDLLVRTCLRILDFVVECRLQILRHMFEERLFRHLLHTGVDARVNLQAIRVNVIVRTILLRVLIAPAIQWVGFPSHRVVVILLTLPRSVLAAFRALCHHDDTQVLTEVWSGTFLVGSDFGFGQQREGLGFHFVHLLLRDVTLLHHLS